MITRPVSSLQPGIRFARALKSAALAKGDISGAAMHAELNYRDSPEVAAALQQKAAVPAMTTGSASALDDFGISSDLRLLLSKTTAFDQAQSRMRRVPMATAVPRAIDAGTASGFVAQGCA